MSEPEQERPDAHLSGVASDRVELAEWLMAHGASVDEIERAAATEEWNLLAGDVALRSGRPTVSLRDAALRLGRPYEEVMAVWRASGFVIPEDDSPVLAEAEIEGYFRVLGLTLQLFGLDATIQLVRVLSSSVSTVADALVAVFHAGLGLQAAKDDTSGLAVARAASAAATPLVPLGRAVELLLRRHLISLMRPIVVPDADASGYDTVSVAVGFVDLVGFTGLTNHESLQGLNAVVGAFNDVAHRVVTSHGGRVVKFIGDEVMFVVPSADGAAGAVTELLLELEASGLPQGRAGVAWGAALTRDGDYFGTCVNLASRLTRLAEPRSALITAELHGAISSEFRSPAGMSLVPGQPTLVRGFEQPVSVYVIRGDP